MAATEACPSPTSWCTAQDLARRYRCEFVDLKNFHIQHELFRKIKVDLMFRYNFVPLQETQDGRLVIAIADPSQLMMIDEISLNLGRRIVIKVATLSQISDVLKKTEQSQRVLEEAGENFALDVIHDDENSDETISIEKLTAESDISPIIKLVDTMIFTALQRRASDIHIETRDDSVVDQVPHRRRAATGDAADREGASLDHHFAHQGDERAGYFGTARAAGWPLPGALQRTVHRLSRVDHAVDPW